MKKYPKIYECKCGQFTLCKQECSDCRNIKIEEENDSKCECRSLCRCQQNGEEQVGLIFKMPMDGKLEIRSSKPIEEYVGSEEEIDGVVYKIYWNDVPLPWHTATKLQAHAIALGCQWGAQEMIRRWNG